MGGVVSPPRRGGRAADAADAARAVDLAGRRGGRRSLQRRAARARRVAGAETWPAHLAALPGARRGACPRRRGRPIAPSAASSRPRPVSVSSRGGPATAGHQPDRRATADPRRRPRRPAWRRRFGRRAPLLQVLGPEGSAPVCLTHRSRSKLSYARARRRCCSCAEASVRRAYVVTTATRPDFLV